jgi:hypothetical protein
MPYATGRARQHTIDTPLIVPPTIAKYDAQIIVPIGMCR